MLPLRLTFTQYGTAALTNAVCDVLPPVAVRTSKYMYVAQSDVMAFVDPPSSVSRIITPAAAYPEPAPCTLTSRATIVPSPVSG